MYNGIIQYSKIIRFVYGELTNSRLINRGFILSTALILRCYLHKNVILYLIIQNAKYKKKKKDENE